VTILLIGFGQVVRYVHLPALLALPQVRLAGVAVSSPASVAEARQQVGAVPIFVDWREALDVLRPTIAVVATPNHLHSEMAIAAMRAGSHLLLEKPAVLNAGEGAAVSAARRSGRSIAVNMTLRLTTAARLARALVEDQSPGGPYEVDLAYSISRPEPSWYFQPAASGGGVVSCVGVHALDLAAELTGQALSNVHVGRLHPEIGAEHAATITATLGSTGQARAAVDWLAPGLQLVARVSAPGATVALALGPGDRWSVSSGGTVVEEGRLWSELVTKSGLRDLVESLARGSEPRCTLDSHLAVLSPMWRASFDTVSPVVPQTSAHDNDPAHR
jgi:predicted dehydrogenase